MKDPPHFKHIGAQLCEMCATFWLTMASNFYITECIMIWRRRAEYRPVDCVVASTASAAAIS